MSKQAEDVMTMDEDDLPHPADMRYGKPAPDLKKAAQVIRDLMEFCVEPSISSPWANCLREQARDAIKDLEGAA